MGDELTQYNNLASIYDELTDDHDLDGWISIIEQFKQPQHQSILDLGCGTGKLLMHDTLSNQFKRRVGIDLSESMINLAQTKSNQVEYHVMDMVEMKFNETFDMLTCLCDSLNYVTEIDSVHQLFKQAFNHLSTDGVLIFDVHTLEKVKLFTDGVFYEDREEIFYHWTSDVDDDGYIDHELTFFVKKDELFERFDEFHTQRTFSKEMYLNLLEDVGFSRIEVFYDFNREDVHYNNQHRMFFAAFK